MTHYTKISKVSLALLEDVTLKAGGTKRPGRTGRKCRTPPGTLPNCGTRLACWPRQAASCAAAPRACSAGSPPSWPPWKAKSTPKIQVIMVDFTGQTKIAEAAA